MEIELATQADIDGILALQTQIYRVSKVAVGTRQVLTDQLKSNCCDVVVVRANNKIVGTATLYYITVAARAGRYGFLEGLVVDKNYRQKGIGTALFKKIIEMAKAQNCYKLLFTSGKDRQWVHAFYQKIGFDKWGWEFRMDL